MNLTGMQIFKYLPAAKKAEGANCKACGCPTCMGYAIKLAKKQADIRKCPYVPEDLKAKFLEASKIQQHVLKLSDSVVTGGENVMYRHDKTFVNRTVIAVELNADDYDFCEKLKRIQNYRLERIGETFKVDAIYLTSNIHFHERFRHPCLMRETAEDKSRYSQAYWRVRATDMAIITPSDNNYAIVKGFDLEELEYNSRKAIDSGKENILLELSAETKPLSQTVEELTYIRHKAIVERDEPFTYPVMVRLPFNENLYETCAFASAFICKYANVIVLKEFDEALVTSLCTLRQNIYTNPQKPLQVEAKVYEFNEPDRTAPILLTTNFALTYFAVAGELESLPFGSYLVVTPSDGMSVLTAWSADKFTAELVARSVRDYGLLQKVDTRKIIIPGLLSHMQEELQEAMPEWQIVTGTIEACQIPEFLKSV